MKVETRKLSELHLLEKNVRRHSEKQLQEYQRSLKMFGQIRPVVIDEDNTILAGNGMVEAMKRLGWEECECQLITGLTHKQKIKLTMADNRIYELGMTDTSIFEQLVRELGEDVDVPGWDEDLLSMLNASVADADDMISDYGVYEPEEVDRAASREQRIPQPSDGASVGPQGDAAIVDSPAYAPVSGPNAGPEIKYIICPHCGQRIPLEGGA